MIDAAALQARLDGVRARIVRAARRAGRDPGTVRLIAVSKTFPLSDVRLAAGAGQVDFGESRIQEAGPKIDATRDLPVRWHLIGHLQSNKVRKAVELFPVIHSIDSVDLLRRVDRAATDGDRRVDVLVQVDLAGEATKHGVPERDVRSVVNAAASCHAVRLVGLMLLPPWNDDPEATRPHFAALRSLRDHLIAEGLPSSSLGELSMGMSHDFDVAIEEGATMVRVGTAIFGDRDEIQASGSGLQAPG